MLDIRVFRVIKAIRTRFLLALKSFHLFLDQGLLLSILTQLERRCKLIKDLLVIASLLWSQLRLINPQLIDRVLYGCQFLFECFLCVNHILNHLFFTVIQFIKWLIHGFAQVADELIYLLLVPWSKFGASVLLVRQTLRKSRVWHSEILIPIHFVGRSRVECLLAEVLVSERIQSVVNQLVQLFFACDIFL